MRLNKLRTEPFRRWAAGFSSLCFVLVGAPLAIQMKRSDMMSTFGCVFLPILIIYYPFFHYGFDRAKTGALPPYSVWAANLVMVGNRLLDDRAACCAISAAIPAAGRASPGSTE